jgi:EAL domain-containing protein (putative c-di-GMP-specific phosphodiesterase class I)
MHDLPSTYAGTIVAYLEHYPEQGGGAHRIRLDPLPFRIGRSKQANWVICSSRVSKEHAEIIQTGDEFRIRDLGSTNGTFINGQRVDESALVEGDILHVAHEEFLFGCECTQAADGTRMVQTDPVTSELPNSLIRSGEYLRELVAACSVCTAFQPIVSLAHGDVLGYEALGRGTHPELNVNPGDLFALASQLQLAADLSRTFRRAAAEEAQHLPPDTHIFLNVHPDEMKDNHFLIQLRELRGLFRTDQRLVAEVHEHAMTDLAAMRRLREQLRELGIGLAFDDFGVGQSRLVELAEAPPNFVKLDRSLVHGIDTAAARQDLVQFLCRATRDLGVRLIAEGIETLAEAEVCQSLGCHYGQGYLFGRPAPAARAGKN